MTTNNREINFFDIVRIIKKNFLKILLLSLLILIIPTTLIYKNYTKDLYTLKFNYELILKTSNNLRLANDSINQLYHNQLFRGLTYKLEMFYTEFVNSEITNDLVLSPSNQDKVNFINNKYILKSLKKSEFIRKNEIFVEVENLEETDYLYDISIDLSKTVKGDDLKNVDKIIANLSDNINKILVDEIILTIEDASRQFQIAKIKLIESLKKSNELISKSYIFDLQYKIDELENRLEIVKYIESKENVSNLREYFKSYDTETPIGEFINLSSPGSGVILRQIDQLNNKINLPLDDLPQVYFNNQLIQLVESEFLKNQIINTNNFPYNSSDIFYLTDYSIVDHSLSHILAIAYLSFFIIFSFIVAIILFIIFDIIKKYK